MKAIAHLAYGKIGGWTVGLLCALAWAAGAATERILVLPSDTMAQGPRPGTALHGAPARLSVIDTERGFQVALGWKKDWFNLAELVRHLVSAPADSCLVEWTAANGSAVRESWCVDRDLGLLASPRPWSWYERTRGASDWGFRCAALGLETSAQAYDLTRYAPRLAALARLKDLPPDTSAAAEPGPDDYVWVEELPVAIRKVPPDYPDVARSENVEGTIVLKVLIGVDGRVRKALVVKSCPGLDAAAVAAVRQWLFEPARAKGAPVAVWVAIPVKFSLN